MPEQWQIDNAKAHLLLARYLLSKADERGTTHGEKHHVIFVALSEIVNALNILTNDNFDLLSRYDDTDPKQVKGLPDGRSRF
jgi:hypothetical protein